MTRRQPIADAPGPIMGRMAEIEVELAELGNSWATAAHDAKRLDRLRKKREAQLYVAKKGSGTIEDMKASVQDEMWVEATEDGEFLMEVFIVAEATDAASTALFKTLDRELSSLQSRLNALLQMERVPSQQGQTGVGHG
jgi:hypothetical protein